MHWQEMVFSENWLHTRMALKRKFSCKTRDQLLFHNLLLDQLIFIKPDTFVYVNESLLKSTIPYHIQLKMHIFNFIDIH